MTPKNSNFSQRAHFLKKYKVWVFPCDIGIFLSYVWFTHNSKKLKHKTYNTSRFVFLFYFPILPCYQTDSKSKRPVYKRKKKKTLMKVINNSYYLLFQSLTIEKPDNHSSNYTDESN